MIEEKSDESGSNISDSDEDEPAFTRAISEVKRHRVFPTSCEIRGHMKLFETKGRLLGKERRVAYTMYDLLVIGAQRPLQCQWVVKRRFSEFRRLRKELIKIVSSSNNHRNERKKIPLLPKRRLAGSTSNTVIGERIKGINIFIQAVISMDVFKDETVLLKFLSEDALDIRPIVE